MAATVQQHHHHIKALKPTWLLVKVSTATAPPNAQKQPVAACSPLLLSPSAWQKAREDKKSKHGVGGMPQQQHHHIKALTPTWLLVKVSTATAPPNAKKQPAAACSPLLLSPSAWQKAREDKKSKHGIGGMPESPRIGCMGQVKGRGSTKGWCSNAPARRSGHGHGGALATLVLGLFGRRRRDGRASRACSKVRDVSRGSSRSSASAPGRSHGGGSVPATAAAALDPPLPVVVRRPARGSNAPSLWERRRGGGKALEGLLLPQIAAETESG